METFYFGKEKVFNQTDRRRKAKYPILETEYKNRYDFTNLV